MNYTAQFPTAAIQKKFYKELAHLKKSEQSVVLDVIRSLEHDPRPFGRKPFKQLVPPIVLYQFAAQYRIRIGNHRVLYDVDDQKKIVWIFALRKRNEATYS
ncbi:MAG: type II toxin-antitoxin system RelE/ParE family toxin [Candidatus Omnitrophica bacterium]|nr:type II toxin-antitoxin system RelE/ParE family toxin [Candidatus Omnitrophota bacterium]